MLLVSFASALGSLLLAAVLCATTSVVPPKYVFVGHGNATEARQMCRRYKGLPMPKTALEQYTLQAAITAALVQGDLSYRWPNTTIWIGGRWIKEAESDPGRWVWDDGSAVGLHGAASEKLGAMMVSAEIEHKEDQTSEPWMCRMADGLWKDTEGKWKFGVFCEENPVGLPTATVTTTSLVLDQPETTMTATTNTIAQQQKRTGQIVGGVVGGLVAAAGVGLTGALLADAETTTTGPPCCSAPQTSSFIAPRGRRHEPPVIEDANPFPWQMLIVGSFLLGICIYGSWLFFKADKAPKSSRDVMAESTVESSDNEPTVQPMSTPLVPQPVFTPLPVAPVQFIPTPPPPPRQVSVPQTVFSTTEGMITQEEFDAIVREGRII